MSWNAEEEQGQQPTEAVALWPEGPYEGVYQSHEFGSSMLKGTPYIRYKFLVNERTIEITSYLTDGTAASVQDEMNTMNQSGTYPDITFSPSGPVKLYMKYEQGYKKPAGVMEERWRISSVKPADQSFMARFFAQAATRKPPPPPPSGKPNPPAPPGKPKAPAAPAPAKPKAPAAPAKPKKDDAHAALLVEYNATVAAATDQDTAWSAWVIAKCESAELFWQAVADQGGEESMTPEKWKLVAGAAPPF